MIFNGYKRSLGSGILAVAVLIVGAGAADADHYPYYFVDNGNNKRGLYVNSGCAHGVDCVNVGDLCGHQFYSSRTTDDVAMRILNNGGKVYILKSPRPHDLVCTVVSS